MYAVPSDLQVRGLTLLHSMPGEASALRNLCNRIGFPKPTYYGVGFSVKAKPEANNLAYTASTLGLHCDLPFYMYNPGTYNAGTEVISDTM